MPVLSQKIFLLFLVCSLSAFAENPPNDQESFESSTALTALKEKQIQNSLRPPRLCSRAISKIGEGKITTVLIGGSGGVLATIATTDRNYHHDVAQLFSRSHHIGYGIYLDKSKISDFFTGEAAGYLKDVKAHEDDIIKYLQEKLKGGYDLSRINKGDLGGAGTGENVSIFSSDYLLGIDAREFINAERPDRGLCRHKAVVMAAVLNAVGIEAKYQRVALKPNYASREADGSPMIYHAVVHLPGKKAIFDPTWQGQWTEEDYKRDIASFR